MFKVILATGFEFHFPMVEHGKLIPVHDNVVDLYQYMFPTETSDHNTLAVIGLIQVSFISRRENAPQRCASAPLLL